MRGMVLIHVLLKDIEISRIHNICVLYDRYISTADVYSELLSKVELKQNKDMTLLLVSNIITDDEPADSKDYILECISRNINNYEHMITEMFIIGQQKVEQDDYAILDFNTLMTCLYNKEPLHKPTLHRLDEDGCKCAEIIALYEESHDLSCKDYMVEEELEDGIVIYNDYTEDNSILNMYEIIHKDLYGIDVCTLSDKDVTRLVTIMRQIDTESDGNGLKEKLVEMLNKSYDIEAKIIK